MRHSRRRVLSWVVWLRWTLTPATVECLSCCLGCNHYVHGKLIDAPAALEVMQFVNQPCSRHRYLHLSLHLPLRGGRTFERRGEEPSPAATASDPSAGGRENLGNTVKMSVNKLHDLTGRRDCNRSLTSRRCGTVEWATLSQFWSWSRIGLKIVRDDDGSLGELDETEEIGSVKAGDVSIAL